MSPSALPDSALVMHEEEEQGTTNYDGISASDRKLKSRAVNLLIALASLPLQALAFFVISRAVHWTSLCIGEVYEVTGRRARSKFASFPWVRVGFGVLLLAIYHVRLAKLVVKSWKELQRDG